MTLNEFNLFMRVLQGRGRINTLRDLPPVRARLHGGRFPLEDQPLTPYPPARIVELLNRGEFMSASLEVEDRLKCVVTCPPPGRPQQADCADTREDELHCYDSIRRRCNC